MANAVIVSHADTIRLEQFRTKWIEKLDSLLKLIEGTQCQLKEIDKNYSTNL